MLAMADKKEMQQLYSMTLGIVEELMEGKVKWECCKKLFSSMDILTHKK
jgi:hypothetical protein